MLFTHSIKLVKYLGISLRKSCKTSHWQQGCTKGKKLNPGNREEMLAGQDSGLPPALQNQKSCRTWLYVSPATKEVEARDLAGHCQSPVSKIRNRILKKVNWGWRAGRSAQWGGQPVRGPMLGPRTAKPKPTKQIQRKTKNKTTVFEKLQGPSLWTWSAW